MPYPTVSFRMTFEWPWVHDLAKHSMTRSIVRLFCDSWASCSFVYSGMERIVGLVLFITFAYSITTDTFWPHTLLDQSIYNSRTRGSTLIYLSALSAHTGNERLWYHARYVTLNTSITLLSFVRSLLTSRKNLFCTILLWLWTTVRPIRLTFYRWPSSIN